MQVKTSTSLCSTSRFDRCSRLAIASLLVIAGAATSAVQGANIYVDASAFGPEDGSFFDPFNTIQEGIDAASSGDTVVVRDGVYQGAGNTSLLLPCNNITIRSSNGWGFTTIDGSAGGSGFIINGPGVSAGTSRIEGFRFVNLFHLIGGAAIDCEDCTIEVVDCQFESNSARSYGGAASFVDSVVDMDACGFESNTTDDGGAVYFNRSDATVSACSFTAGNLANELGGAMFITGQSDVSIIDSAFSGSHAEEDGGEIAVRSASLLSVSNSTFSDSSATWNGGAIHARAASVTLDQVSFNATEAEDRRGGALMAVEETWVIISNSNFLNCSSYWGGGAIFADDSTIEVSASSFGGNDAGTQGGALRLRYGAAGTVTDVDFDGNSAQWDGGAITSSDGSTLSVSGNSTFTSNTAATDGGAISSTDASELTVSNTTFADNSAERGGAVFTENAAATTLVDGSEFFENFATSDNGGAISSIFGQLDVSNSHFNDNEALSGYGGGVSTSSETSLTVNGSTFTRNNALSGGGLSAENVGATTWLNDCIFKDNAAIGSSGGGVLNLGATIDIVDTEFSENTATGAGGGLLTDGNLTITGASSFVNNEANEGGGLCVVFANMTLTGTAFNLNLAYTFGGGLSATQIENHSKLDQCTFGTNSATDGGGLAVVAFDILPNASTFEADECIFEYNKVIDGLGGGAYHEGAQVSTVVEYKWSHFRWNESRDGNCNGGALALVNTDSTVHNDRFRGNIADVTGGGIFAARSLLDLAGTDFSGNWADSTGGAMRIEDFTTANVSNCTLSLNGRHDLEPLPTSAGGGMYILDSTVAVRNTIFNDNEDASGITFAAQMRWMGSTSDYERCLFHTGTCPPNSMLIPYGGTNTCGLPMLVDPVGADGIIGTVDDQLDLQAGSDAIDSGDNNEVAADLLDVDDDPLTVDPLPLDDNGDDRFQDAGGVAGTGVSHAIYTTLALVDIGAYEFEGDATPTPAGDVDGDGDVDFADLNDLLTHWSAAVPTGMNGDLNGDGLVNFEDLNILLGTWGEGI